jgi:hypothetical protein
MRHSHSIFGLTFISVCMWILCGCDAKTNKKKMPDISQDSALQIISQWKSDTSGCLRLRHPDKIKLVIDKFGLIGRDSVEIIKYLGRPNTKMPMGDTATVFYYFMDCPRPYKDRAGNIISSVNFHCEFDRTLLTNTRAPILD